MVDRVKAIIQLNHLWHNYQLLKSLHQDKEVMAVVKADAYGHGAVEVATYLEEMGCRYFAVTDLIEAIELRKGGLKSPVLILGKTSPKHCKELKNYNLIQTVDSLAYAERLNQEQIGINTHLIIDTGMSRFGIYCHRSEDLLKATEEGKAIFDLKYLNPQGVYTHFAVADEFNDEISKQQFSVFKRFCDTLESCGYNLGLKHCANSAAIIKFNDFQMDMVRAGIAMYGYPPVKTQEKFLPVMSIFAKIIAIRNLVVGDGVSYGLTYQVCRPMRVASVAIGYGDGYDRIFSNQDYFVVQNQKCPVVGRVCMGVTMIDIGQLDLMVGDFVEVFGHQKPLEPMAKKIGTITYELLTNMSKKRVHFIYNKSGELF